MNTGKATENFPPAYPDFKGWMRIESTATGRRMLIDHLPDGVRVRRRGPDYPQTLDIVLEWWDGQRWLRMDEANEISNDYAWTYIRDEALALCRELNSRGIRVPPPPKDDGVPNE